jgi:hypothetical protein
MLGKVAIEVRLPCPPPDDVLALMRDRARGFAPTPGMVKAIDCRGCTASEAERIWHAAAETARLNRSN